MRRIVQAKGGSKDNKAILANLPKPDMVVMAVSIVCYFIYQLNFVLIEA